MSQDLARPLTLVMPYCPVCGDAALFDEVVSLAGVPRTQQIWRVICLGCQWQGESKKYMPLPVEDPSSVGELFTVPGVYLTDPAIGKATSILQQFIKRA